MLARRRPSHSRERQLNEEGIIHAQVSIETLGHCAMKENGFLDDGTSTVVKVLELLAQKRQMQLQTVKNNSLVDWSDGRLEGGDV
jgi:hypothetical protein